jgi:hypothetical protein
MLTLEILFILSYLPIPRELGPKTPRSIASAAVWSILPKKHPSPVAPSMRAQAVYSTSILAQRRPHDPKGNQGNACHGVPSDVQRTP